MLWNLVDRYSSIYFIGLDGLVCLTPWVLPAVQSKRLYVQISNIIDTSIKYPISGQSISMVKGCMDICFDMVDTVFSYWRALISVNFFQSKRKKFVCNLKCTYCIFYFVGQNWWKRIFYHLSFIGPITEGIRKTACCCKKFGMLSHVSWLAKHMNILLY